MVLKTCISSITRIAHITLITTMIVGKDAEVTMSITSITRITCIKYSTKFIEGERWVS